MSEIKNEVATLDLMGSKHEFPIMEGSVGPSVVNISKLYAATGQLGAF